MSVAEGETPPIPEFLKRLSEKKADAELKSERQQIRQRWIVAAASVVGVAVVAVYALAGDWTADRTTVAPSGAALRRASLLSTRMSSDASSVEAKRGAETLPSPAVSPVAPASPPVTVADADPHPTPTPAPPAPSPVVASPTPNPHGLDATEIRFGMVSPFTGANRESGLQLKIGVETAFAEVNEAGGVNGRKLRLMTVDDGYEPARTLPAVRDLYEKKDVLGFVCNFGSATSAAALPYILQNRALYFGALSGASLLRQDPPDRYVFNFRPSYGEETAAAVRYVTRVRGVLPKEIVVFAQEDAFGDAGYEGVAKTLRALNADAKPYRIGYKRNTIEVSDAVKWLTANRSRVKAVVMVATYRAAAKFIEKTREAMPDLIYTNVSAVGATSLAEELKLLGPKFADGVIVTQITPAVAGSASSVLKYKDALKKYAPGQEPDYTSFEAYIDANVLIEAIRRAGRDLDIEKVVGALEGMRDLDLGLGTPLRYDVNDHQASHKVWGTRLTSEGSYQPVDLE